ncbi:MAG: NAD(P)H-dependent oxidoreductase [Sneathiella sp.]
MTNKILVLEGHPEKKSFCNALAEAVKAGALEVGAEVRHVKLTDLDFEASLQGAYQATHDLEPDLEQLWEEMKWCDRMILVHPLWWGAAPAKLKGLFDRLLRPGEAFHYEEGKALPIGHLKGRMAEALITSDTPTWYLRWIYRAGWHVILKKQILEFCGFKVGRIRNLGPMLSANEQKRARFLDMARKVGRAV